MNDVAVARLTERGMKSEKTIMTKQLVTALSGGRAPSHVSGRSHA
jgi:hypothetical protein